MKRRTVAVIFGGVSSEHEVSAVSAMSVLRNIPRDVYDVIMVGITREGRWLKYGGPLEKLRDGSWREDKSCVPAVISPDAGAHGLLVLGKTVETVPIDVVFPVLHGKNGEDGTVQGLFQLAQIPFVGCDNIASAVCMDKAVTNALADAAGIPQAKWRSITQYEYNKIGESFLEETIAYLSFPIFVKPACAGSSVGISKALNRGELRKAMETAFLEDDKAVLEEAVLGKEVECAVMGNHDPVAGEVGEIRPANEFYDYNAKYENAESELFIPARLTEEKRKETASLACRAYRAMGCEGLSRVDFFIRDDGTVLLNEINTLPGFTSISMYPKLFEAAGVPYGELLHRLITLALERGGKV